MYRCELCGQITKPGQPSYKVVTESRERSYLPPQDPPSDQRGGRNQRFRRKKPPSGGVGLEIVTEKLVCADCADTLQPEE